MLKESENTQSLKHPINSCPIHLLSGWLEQGDASKHEEAIQKQQFNDFYNLEKGKEKRWLI